MADHLHWPLPGKIADFLETLPPGLPLREADFHLAIWAGVSARTARSFRTAFLKLDRFNLPADWPPPKERPRKKCPHCGGIL